MIRLLLLLALAAFLTSCGSLQPVNDSAERATLVLPPKESGKKLFPAPVFTVVMPTYLNESTVWYSDDSGVLTALNNYVWADSLSKTLRQELSLGLAREKAYPPTSRMDIVFARFNLLADGSALAVAEIRFYSPSVEEILPIVRISIKDVWNPSNPSSYLSGYRALLEATVQEIRTILPSPESASTNETDTTQDSSE